MGWFAKGLFSSWRLWRGLRVLALRSAFRRCGKNVRFDPDSILAYENIEIGDDVFIGPRATLLAAKSGIIIGSKVMFGPNVTIMGGDHNASVIGQFMFDVKSKRPEDDQTVVVEDDVWVGTGAIILKGVRLERGCIVAAGAVVARDVPPYTVVAGVPAKVLRTRFSIDTILLHESRLYPPEKRLSIEYLLATLQEYIGKTSDA